MGFGRIIGLATNPVGTLFNMPQVPQMPSMPSMPQMPKVPGILGYPNMSQPTSNAMVIGQAAPAVDQKPYIPAAPNPIFLRPFVQAPPVITPGVPLPKGWNEWQGYQGTVAPVNEPITSVKPAPIPAQYSRTVPTAAPRVTTPAAPAVRK